MNILQISVGTPTEREFEGRVFSTGIFKTPVAGSVKVGLTNLEGDGQADLTVHGGRDKSIYVYSHDYYPEWAFELGRTELEWSQFGENLTVAGGKDDSIVIGSTYRINDVRVVVSQPRIPCFKLGARVRDKAFPARFWTAGRLGFYLRVESEGTIHTGHELVLENEPEHGITLKRLHHIVCAGTPDEARFANETLDLIDDGWRRRLRQRNSG